MSLWTCLPLLLVTTLPAWANPAAQSPARPAAPARVRFEVKAAQGTLAGPTDGRLLVILGGEPEPEPRLSLGGAGPGADPVLSTDVRGFAAGKTAVLDRGSALFPQASLGEVPAGDYWVQAVLRKNPDLLLTDAPGNLFSTPMKVRVDPARRATIRLTLDQKVSDESLPAETDQVKFLKLRSESLSRFWGRPMFLRAGIILPRDWAAEPTRRYPLVIRIGGFGTRFTWVAGAMREDAGFRKQWLADDTPRCVLLQLDGAGPLGDPYQIDSANHGPWGTALVEELLPYVEAAYRCVGQPHTRFTTGGSTGGWVALALQALYPDVFGGCWSGYPDPVDFRALPLVNLYADENAFVNGAGHERPCARTLNGDTKFTMRRQTQLENVLGSGDSYAFSGGQLGSWNAAFSPRGADGRPGLIWDARTGRINREVAEHWRQFDLRMLLADNWPALAPKLRGKIRLWMGDADDYFLDGAARLLDDFLRATDPPPEARLEFGPRQRHGWEPRSWSELLREMQAAVEANAPKSAAANLDYLRARFGHAVSCPHCKGGR